MPPKRKAPIAATEEEDDEPPEPKKGRAKALTPAAPSGSEDVEAASASAIPQRKSGRRRKEAVKELVERPAPKAKLAAKKKRPAPREKPAPKTTRAPRADRIRRKVAPCNTRKKKIETEEGKREGLSSVKTGRVDASSKAMALAKRKAPAARRARKGVSVEESGDDGEEEQSEDEGDEEQSEDESEEEEFVASGTEVPAKRQAAADDCITTRHYTLEPKHKVFLSHSGAQKSFVEQLCVDLERRDRYPFFDRRQSSLPIGKNFPNLIFEAIEQCEVGVLVLSEEFFTRSKWPMVELVAMRKNPNLELIPVYFDIAVKQVCNLEKQKRWLKVWHGWSLNDTRIDIEEWQRALKALGPINGLIYDGLSEVSFREKIVDVVCELVLPQSKWKDSHVQGRSRLCQVVCEKIDQAKVSNEYGARVVGLYGMGGIGKTTICQALCNVYSKRMQGRVCHVELGIASDLNLLQEALKRLTNKSHKFVSELTKGECEDLLKKEMPKNVVFLAIDNVSDDQVSINQAKLFLSGGFGSGSVILVTSRSLEVLKMHHLGIDEINCMEMPELVLDEAKALFLQHAIHDHDTRNEVANDKVIENCVKHCNFQKGDGRSYHYHPLALKVLGMGIGCNKYDLMKWAAELKELDVFNRQREPHHPIFSILRKSFDTLLPEDQMLFMDVALFLPEFEPLSGSWSLLQGRLFHETRVSDSMSTLFEWLSMIHETSVPGIMARLEGLRRKSLLEDLGGHYGIGMHDLWREFSKLETKAGEFESRRWIYEVKESSGLEGSTPPGGFWYKVKRMCFSSRPLTNVRGINLNNFSNIIVLKLAYLEVSQPIALDMKSLKHLKSFELTFGLQSCAGDVHFTGLRLVENLHFLDLRNAQFSPATVHDIGYLTNLDTLNLDSCPGVIGILNLNNFIRLRKLSLRHCHNLIQLTCTRPQALLQELALDSCGSLNGILDFSNFSGLRNLWLSGCKSLMELTCNGPLPAVEVLFLDCCDSLNGIPDLHNFPLLKGLWLHGCKSLMELTCTGPLAALKELCLHGCGSLNGIPDLSNFPRLTNLRLSGCTSLMELTCNGPLAALKVLRLGNCGSLNGIPNLNSFPLIKELWLSGCKSLMELTCNGPLAALKGIYIYFCGSLNGIPDLSNFPRLTNLRLSGCTSLMELTCNGPLAALKVLHLDNCGSLNGIPNLNSFPVLKELWLNGCKSLMELTCNGPLAALEELCLDGCASLNGIPDLHNFPLLKGLWLHGCKSLMELTCNGPLAALKVLRLDNCGSLNGIPNLNSFPVLKELWLSGCTSLMELTCNGPLAALKVLRLDNCGSLYGIPNLNSFPVLKELWLSGCTSLMELTCNGPLAALKVLRLDNCGSLNGIPNLNSFPVLKELWLSGCTSLMELTCNGPLAALEELGFDGCGSLNGIPDLSNFPRLKKLWLNGLESLTEVTSSGPLGALVDLGSDGRWSTNGIPDLSNFPLLKKLGLNGLQR
ncbi:hypothetical protein M758_5G022300 [Ceratodon purpureus]|nr:hypothetical protein M758_5G022300 [Ceratodon purpureus]